MTPKRKVSIEKYLAVAKEVRVPETDTNEQFTKFVNHTLALLEMNDADFAQQIPVSKQSVMRWRSGRAYPHRALWTVIYDLLYRAMADAIEVNP